MNSCRTVILTLSLFLVQMGTPSSMDELFYSTDKMIRLAGYPSERHRVTTADGYILSLFRIPQRDSPKAPPVLMVHGFLATSDCWVLQGAKKDLAFLLHDAGYDVWLGDLRGNCYSRNHSIISPSDPMFWKFSFHHMGIYDVPALVDHILNETQHKKLIYIGHSMGGTSYYVMMSEKPEYNEKISLFVGLAPAGIMVPTNESPEKKYFLGLAARFIDAMREQNRVELLPRVSWAPFLANTFCSEDSTTQNLCFTVSFFWAGVFSKSISKKSLPLVLSHAPGGASLETARHFLQNIDFGKFQPMDYGKEINMELYNSSIPPEYNLSNLKTPVALFYSEGDALVNASDIELTMKRIPNIVYTKVHKHLNHVDYLWGRSAWRELYPDILRILTIREPDEPLKNFL